MKVNAEGGGAWGSKQGPDHLWRLSTPRRGVCCGEPYDDFKQAEIGCGGIMIGFILDRIDLFCHC